MKQKTVINKIFFLFVVFVSVLLLFLNFYNRTYAMPFYDLQPKNMVLRASFYTSYKNSNENRKNNIKLASKSLNNTLIAPMEEFSFNRIVGERTISRGYKNAKIIVNGEFVDGVGGGVCQVSTTLYNAILLAGLTVTEYHPHSLPVNYVAPSFDAMVNSGWADLKFVNQTHNPIIIRSFANDEMIKIEIYGEPMDMKIVRKSVVTEEILCPEYEIIKDELGEFPELLEGEQKIVRYGKNGYKSEGFILIFNGKKLVCTKKIRKDSYLAVKGKIILGTTKKPSEIEEILN